MRHGETCTSRDDIKKYFKEIEMALKENRGEDAFDRIADLDNVWLKDQPYWMSRDEWKQAKNQLQGFMRRL